MALQDLKYCFKELGIETILWEDCAIDEEMVNSNRAMSLYQGTCKLDSALKKVVFKRNRTQINPKTRRSVVNAIYNEMKECVTHMHQLPQQQDRIIRLHGVTFGGLNPIMIVEHWLYDLEYYLENEIEMGRSIDLSEKLRICLDVLMGVRALHDAGIVHGSLRAENIVMVKNRFSGLMIAKVLEFGSSCLLSSDGADAGFNTIFLAPERMYTFRSMFPQLVKWERLANQDIFGFGLLLWQLAMDGRRPYSKEVEKRVGAVDMEEKRLKDCDLQELMNELPQNIDADLVSIIRNATKLIPSERASLNDIENSLNQLLYYTKTSFKEVSIESTASSWMQVNTPIEVNNPSESNDVMESFTKFSKTACHDSSLPTDLSDVDKNLKQSVFSRCHEGASQLLAGNLQFLVACCYYWGFGASKSNRDAFDWLVRAAESKSAEAHLMLGDFYRLGIAIKADQSKAFEHITRSAGAHNIRAKRLLEMFTRNGECVDKDQSRAESAHLAVARTQSDDESPLKRHFGSFKRLFGLNRGSR